MIGVNAQYRFCRLSVKMQDNRIKLYYNKCNLSQKHNLVLYQTQSRKPNYVDRKIFLNILLGANCTTAWGQTSKHYTAS